MLPILNILNDMLPILNILIIIVGVSMLCCTVVDLIFFIIWYKWIFNENSIRAWNYKFNITGDKEFYVINKGIFETEISSKYNRITIPTMSIYRFSTIVNNT